MKKQILAACVAALLFPSAALASPSDEVKHAVVTLKKTHLVGETVSLSDTLGMVGGDPLYWEHVGADFVTSDSTWDSVRAVKSSAVFPNGNRKTLYSYVIDTMTRDNGYHLVDQESIPEWVTLLGGNQKYVDVNAAVTKTTVTDTISMKSWGLLWMPKVVASSGASLDYIESASRFHVVNADGKTATPTFKITPTPSPNGTVTLDKTTYTQGETVQIGTVANIFAAATNWHYEAVEVVGTNGFSKFLPLITEKDGTAPAANGHGFPYWGEKAGALQFVYGGGSASPTTPNVYKERATLDTSSLPAGTYMVKYTLFDAVGRAAINGNGNGNGTITKTFELKAKTGVPAPTAPADPQQQPSPNVPPAPSNDDVKSKVLTMKFGKLASSYPMGGGQITIPVEVSNSGDKDVTTNLTFSLAGKFVQSYQTEEAYPCQIEGKPNHCTRSVTKYQTLPMKATKTEQITVKARSVYKWQISTASYQIIGGNPSLFTAALSVGGVTNDSSNGWYDRNAKYYPFLTVEAAQPQLFVQPKITASVGTNTPVVTPSTPVLVE